MEVNRTQQPRQSAWLTVRIRPHCKLPLDVRCLLSVPRIWTAELSLEVHSSKEQAQPGTNKSYTTNGLREIAVSALLGPRQYVVAEIWIYDACIIRNRLNSTPRVCSHLHLMNLTGLYKNYENKQPQFQVTSILDYSTQFYTDTSATV